MTEDELRAAIESWKREEQQWIADMNELRTRLSDAQRDAREWHDEFRSEGRARQFYQEENALVESVIEAARQTVKASERLHDTSGGIHRIGLALERYDAHRADESYPLKLNQDKLCRNCPDCGWTMTGDIGAWRCNHCCATWTPLVTMGCGAQ